jgi:hypothetical protein
VKNGGHGASQPGDEDDDPELTAITRRLEETGDTRGAIDELQELLVQRTGAIPVVTPEMLAAHREAAAAPVPAPAPAPAPVPVPAIDWSLTPTAPLSPAPGFSAWVDPAAIAAALEPEAPREVTDVSSKVFAVFSAERLEPAAAEPETVAGDEEVDGIDDLAEPQPAPQPAPAPAAPAPVAPAPPQPPVRVEPPTPVPAKTYDEPLPPPVAPKKRRLWPFGRR